MTFISAWDFAGSHMDLSLSPFLLVMMPSFPSCFEVPPFPLFMPKSGHHQRPRWGSQHYSCSVHRGGYNTKKGEIFRGVHFLSSKGLHSATFFRRKKNPTEHLKKYICKEGKKIFLEKDFTLRDNHATNSQNIFLHYFSYI